MTTLPLARPLSMWARACEASWNGCVRSRLKGRQREIFEATGLTDRIGRDRFFPTVRSAVAAFESSYAGEPG